MAEASEAEEDSSTSAMNRFPGLRQTPHPPDEPRSSSILRARRQAPPRLQGECLSTSPGEAPPPAPVDEPGFMAPVSSEPGFYAPVESQSPSGRLAGPEPPAGAPGAGNSGQNQLKQQIFSAISPAIVELAQELRRSLDYYRSRLGDAPIHEILLVGGTAKLRGLASYLEMELGISTRVGDPLQYVTVSAKSFSEQHLQEVASLFPVCIGLGARDLIDTPGAKGKNRR